MRWKEKKRFSGCPRSSIQQERGEEKTLGATLF